MATDHNSPRNVVTEEESDQGVTSEDDTEVEARVGLRYTVSEVMADQTARLGFIFITIVTSIAIFATIDGQLLNYSIAEQYWHSPVRAGQGTPSLLPPVGFENEFGQGTWQYPLGTDHRGRGVLVRLVYGSRIAIQVGIVSTGLGMSMGVVVGAVSGYYGGWVDDVLMRLVETVYAIPFLVLVIAFMVAFGRELHFAMIGVAIATVPVFARLIRSEVVSVREEEFVEAARSVGLKDRDIIRQHVIPNSFAPVVVQATLQVGVNILTVAGLSFLGFGAQPPVASWGQMLANSRGFMLPNPWFSIWPGLAILFTVIGFNLVGDGLRDALDPRLQN